MKRALFLPLLLAAQTALGSASFPEPVSGDFTIRDFRFASGQILPRLKIHYHTIGTPRRDSAGAVRNAVLILHGTTGSGRHSCSTPAAITSSCRTASGTAGPRSPPTDCTRASRATPTTT